MNNYNKYLEKLNFESFNEMQQETFRAFNLPKNVLLSSETGSGKTYAYLIPLYEALTKNNEIGLIILPTKELVTQLRRMLNPLLDENANLKVYTDTNIKNKKEPTLIILNVNELDYLKDQGYDMSKIKYVVFDEADMLLEGDYINKTLYFLNYFKSIKQVIVSATISPQIAQIIKENAGNFTKIDQNVRFKRQKHYILRTFEENRTETLKNLIGSINPFLCLIFVSHKDNIMPLYKELKDNLNVTFISGDDNKIARKNKLLEITKLKYQYVITSDLLSRGIDLDVSDVINYDIPMKLDYFIHRSGRTARYDKSGNIYTLYTDKDARKLESLIKKGIKFNKINVKNNEIKIIKERQKPGDELFQKALSKVRKPKKVSPNYKKKNKAKIKRELQKLRKKDYVAKLRKGDRND